MKKKREKMSVEQITKTKWVLFGGRSTHTHPFEREKKKAKVALRMGKGILKPMNGFKLCTYTHTHTHFNWAIIYNDFSKKVKWIFREKKNDTLILCGLRNIFIYFLSYCDQWSFNAIIKRRLIYMRLTFICILQTNKKKTTNDDEPLPPTVIADAITKLFAYFILPRYIIIIGRDIDSNFAPYLFQQQFENKLCFAIKSPIIHKWHRKIGIDI